MLRRDSIRSLVPLALVLAAAGCDPTVDEPERELAEQATDAPPRALTSAEAIERLEQLHARRIERDLPTEALTVFARRGIDPEALSYRFSADGTPVRITGHTLALTAEDLALAPETSVRGLADGFVARFCGLWDVEPSSFEDATVHVTPSSSAARSSVHYRQFHADVPVVGGHVVVHVDTTDPRAPVIVGVSGAFLDVGKLDARPTVETDAAMASVSVEPGETLEEPMLTVWSASRSGVDVPPRLAWKVPVSRDGHTARYVYVDALDGAELQSEVAELYSLQRSMFDMRAATGSTPYTCQNWSAAASCGSHCADCATDPAECALCTCPYPGDPVGCDAQIWRYDESTGCVADGSPLGETSCDSAAQQLWADAEKAHGFWASAFGRDSWDGAGAWMHLISSTDPSPGSSPGFAGVAFPRDLDGDGAYDVSTVAIRSGAGGPWLHGHEFGHMLQHGTVDYDGLSFYGQGKDAMEHHADLHAFRYRGLRLSPGYDCSGPDLFHYTRFRLAGTAQANKYIGNCHGWLMHKSGGATTHYGVSVLPQSPDVYDDIWFAALDDHFSSTEGYFGWWNDIVQGAADVYGFTSPYFTALEARDAIGGWTDHRSVSTGVQPEDRYAAASVQGNANTPCVFYRYTGSTTRIAFSCRSGSGWGPYTSFNDLAVDPAASEPTATYRYESGQTILYVAWAGTDNRIHYRTYDPSTNVIGPPQDLGPNHLTDGPVAIAPVLETGSLDRVVVVYHPLAHPTWFYWTHIGSTSPGIDMGPSFDSEAAPALTPFPYYSRLYFVRPDSMSSATPGRLRYTSYTLDDGWGPAQDLTALFETDAYIQAGAVTSDRGVALTAYGRTSSRLRMTWVTPTSAEQWYATLSESSPGVLERDGYRAVPLASTAGAARSAGGLTADPSGYPMFHFTGQGGSTAPKLFEWRTYSD